MKPSTSARPTNAQGSVCSIHPLLAKLRDAGVQNVEAMETFFAKFDASYKPGLADRQKLCQSVMQLQGLLNGRPLPNSSVAKFTQAERKTLSTVERVLFAGLIYFTSHRNGVDAIRSRSTCLTETMLNHKTTRTTLKNDMDMCVSCPAWFGV